MADGRFPTALRGYRCEEVDALMARVDGTLGRAPLMDLPVTPGELAATSFTVTLRGYDRAAVDRAVSGALAALGGTAPPGYVRAEPPSAAPPPVPPGYGPAQPGAAPPGRGAPASDGERERMVARLRDPRLGTTTLGPGYDQGEVDRFLQDASARLSGGTAWLTADEVRSVAFTTTRFRGGYDEQAVDALLDELIAYLTRYGSR